MRTINYWEQFLSTGKIDDYLAYREDEAVQPEEDMGAKPDAGTGQGYRNDIKSRTRWGV